ncbi:MAG: 1-acyl-sn-glycerol-3-phosphate acyltransferase, partial [Clostridia bacterium]|nr:1-acyl-sn-glycerol-3-phosphate acyltransferase [Clostridia bacterium]
MNKKKKWMRYRHRVVRNIAYALVGTYTRIKCGVAVEKFREQGDRPYLIIMNHQTAYDQFFVGMAFRGPVYYLATEDLFSNGWISRLLSWAIAPIPIKKQTTDVHAVMNCIRIAKEGGTIALAPEDNRTYSGRT